MMRKAIATTLGDQLKIDQYHPLGSVYGCLSIMGSVAVGLWLQENNPLRKYLEMPFDSGWHNVLLFAQLLIHQCFSLTHFVALLQFPGWRGG
jgi:hypothetical protein